METDAHSPGSRWLAPLACGADLWRSSRPLVPPCSPPWSLPLTAVAAAWGRLPLSLLPWKQTVLKVCLSSPPWGYAAGLPRGNCAALRPGMAACRYLRVLRCRYWATLRRCRGRRTWAVLIGECAAAARRRHWAAAKWRYFFGIEGAESRWSYAAAIRAVGASGRAA